VSQVVSRGLGIGLTLTGQHPTRVSEGYHVTEQQSPGRRRADYIAAEPSDEPAPYTEMAAMWRSMSRAQDLMTRRGHQFANTRIDDRLAEQLSLVSMLHDWRWTTATEARELVYLLELYVEPAGDETRDEAAHAAIGAIRRMAARRAKTGPPEPQELGA
jgi:hypothetical protein